METVRHTIKRKLLLEIVTAEIYYAVKRRGAFGRNGFKRKSRKNSPHKNVEVPVYRHIGVFSVGLGNAFERLRNYPVSGGYKISVGDTF